MIPPREHNDEPADPLRALSQAGIPFGKHEGRPLPAVPTGYLTWALRTLKLSSGLRAAVRAELVRRGFAEDSLPPVRPSNRPTSCRKCGGTELKLYWQSLGGLGDRTIRGDCKRCGAYVSYQPATDANIAAADANTNRAAELDVLRQADAEGVDLVNRGGQVQCLPYGKASPRLEALIRQHKRLLLGILPRQNCGSM